MNTQNAIFENGEQNNATNFTILFRSVQGSAVVNRLLIVFLCPIVFNFYSLSHSETLFIKDQFLLSMHSDRAVNDTFFVNEIVV